MKKWLIFVLFFMVPVTGHSLGLGPITMKSALNQPLQAEIEIHSVQKGDLEGLSVRMASDEDFKRISVEKSSFLSRIELKVITREDGTAVIQLSSTRPVSEPYLDFLIEARWPRGRALKEYTVLVDPPVLTAEAPAAIEEARTVTTPPPVSQTPSVGLGRPSAPTSTQRFKPRIAAAPVAAPEEPEPFAPPEPSVPPAPVAAPAPAPRASPAPRAEIAEPTPELAAEPNSGKLNYGQVRRNETLSQIAQTMRPSDVTLQQMMLALLKSNPEAFIGGNINRVKAGAVLRIDDEALLRQFSREEAVVEVSRQHREWRSTKAVRQTEIASSNFRESSGSSSTKGQSSSSSADDARLKLVAPGTKGTGAGGSMEEGTQEVSQLRENLLLATEALDANKQESTELKGRMSELEEQLESMQRLINLKDQEMTALQSQLKKGGEKPVTAEPAKPTAEVKEAANEQPEVVNDSFFSDTTIVSLVVFLVIAVVAWLVIRRKRMQEGFEESILNVGGMEESFARGGFANSKGRASQFSQQPQNAGSMAASGFAMSDMSGIQSETSEVDPISEADVYLAYGRHQQAEDILKQALDRDDHRMDYHAKLLEVYNAARNAQAFEAQARVMREKLGGDVSDPHWQKVAALGAVLCPSSPLFGGGGGSGGKARAQSALASAVGGVTAEEEDLLDFEFDADTDLSFGSGKNVGGGKDNGGGSKKSGRAAAVVEDDDDINLDFDIGSLDFSLEDNTVTSDTSSRGRGFGAKNSPSASKGRNDSSLDFDMGDDNDGDILNFDSFDLETTNSRSGPINLVGDSQEVALGGSRRNRAVEQEPLELSLDDDALTLEEVGDFEDDANLSGEFDDDIFANVDEIGSKLDLAKAYVDMGDSDGARSILDEVMEEGDATQKQQAQRLLQQMG